MRFIVRLRTTNDATIPINYQHALSSALYSFIKEANPDLSSSLHYSNDFKFFNFSNLKIPRNSIKGPVVHLKKGTSVMFNFSSPAADILEATVSGMLSTGKMGILGADFEIETIEMLKTPDFSGRALFRTLSPVYIDILRNGERWDLLPTDPEWRQRIEENSRKKYAHYFGRDYKGDFEIEQVRRMSSKRIEVHGQWWVSANVEFIQKAGPDMIKFLWDAGIGRKNSQGFGCLQFLG